MRSLSDVLTDLENAITGETVSIDNLLDAFHERGFGFFLFLFALPAALPLPAVGVGTILGLPLVFLTAQQAIGRHRIWFPKSWRTKSISAQTVTCFVAKALPWTKRIEKLVKPRLEWVTLGACSNIIGICGFIMALSVCLPFPLTNTIPSFGIAVMAIGVMMRDGLAVIAGLCIGMAWVALLVGVTLLLGTEGVDMVKDVIKGFL